MFHQILKSHWFWYLPRVALVPILVKIVIFWMSHKRLWLSFSGTKLYREVFPCPWLRNYIVHTSFGKRTSSLKHRTAIPRSELVTIKHVAAWNQEHKRLCPVLARNIFQSKPSYFRTSSAGLANKYPFLLRSVCPTQSGYWNGYFLPYIYFPEIGTSSR